MENNKFGYTPNLDQLNQYLKDEESKSSGKGSGPNWWSLPSGMSSIRILPPWDPTGRIALPVYMHPIEYKDDDMKYTKYNWTCINRTFGKPCKICEGLAELSGAGVDVQKYESNRRQFYFNALVMHDPTPQNPVAPGTHVLLKAPKMLYDWVIAQITNPMIGDITSLSNGIDVYVTKSGTGLSTTYVPTLSPNGRTAVPQEYLSKIESLYNLDEVFGAGFDDEQINKLVGHLRRSAGAISQGVANTMNTMGGGYNAPVIPQYQQPAVPQYNPSIPSTPAPNVTNQYFAPVTDPVAPAPTIAPVGFQAPPVQPAPTVPDTPPFDPSPQPVPQPQVSAPAGDASGVSKPKCFGQYNPAQVQCVICAYEADCTKSSH